MHENSNMDEKSEALLSLLLNTKAIGIQYARFGSPGAWCSDLWQSPGYTLVPRRSEMFYYTCEKIPNRA